MNKYRPVSMSKTSGNNAKRPIQRLCACCTMATMLTMTATVKAMDSQRWICRTQVFPFIETSSEIALKGEGQTSVRPRQELLQLREELLPAGLGSPEGLLLIRPEARL